jgi:TfoX/Sxy family transcriptional regulator of competence genes
MPYNETIAIRIREQIKLFYEDFTEKKMFGGLSFLYQDKMTVGIVKGELAVRIIASKMETTLQNKCVRPMDFTKRPMKEFVYVSAEGFKTGTQLLHWIELGLEHAKSKL